MTSKSQGQCGVLALRTRVCCCTTVTKLKTMSSMETPRQSLPVCQSGKTYLVKTRGSHSKEVAMDEGIGLTGPGGVSVFPFG